MNNEHARDVAAAYLVLASAERMQDAPALTCNPVTRRYRELTDDVECFAAGFRVLRIGRADGVGIYLDKRRETIAATFGSTAAAAVLC